MSQLTVTVLQLGLLVLLWLFVLGVVAVLRRDLFGARAGSAASAAPASAAPVRAAPPPPSPSPAPVRPQAPPRAEAPRPARAQALVVVAGPRAGTRFDLRGEPVLLGRSPDCTLVLGDDYASGHHARLVPAVDAPGGWVLEDLGSTNGTSLGRGDASTRVSGSVPVGVGSVFSVGRTTMELR